MRENYTNVILTLILSVTVAICFRLYQLSPMVRTVPDISKGESGRKALVLSGTELLKNAGFETEEDGMPTEWGTWSSPDEKGVKFFRDTDIKHSGEASACVVNTDTDPEQKNLPQWVQHVEHNLPYGQKVVLTGWVKTEDAKAAAVCMRCDGQAKQLAFATTWSYKGPFKDTTDWKPFEISFEVPEGTEYIRIMPFVAGPGKAWFDDLSLKVE